MMIMTMSVVMIVDYDGGQYDDDYGDDDDALITL